MGKFGAVQSCLSSPLLLPPNAVDAFSAERERTTANPQCLGSIQHLRAVTSSWMWKGTLCSQSLHVDTLGARAFPVFVPQGRQPQPAVRPFQREQHRAVPTLFRLKHPFYARNTTCSVSAWVQPLLGVEVLKEFFCLFTGEREMWEGTL